MITLRDRRWELPHVPALDGLRGVAVAGVLLYHAGYLTGGYLGVDLFFVLSGYLITSLLLLERRSTATVDLGSFWSRRARRLLPALYAFLVGVAIYTAIWARPIDMPGILGDALAALVYASNWRNIVSSVDYWAISLAPSPLQHLWSLAIEEQFYLVWPVVLLVATRRRRPDQVVRRVAVVSAVGAALSLGSFAWLHATGASATRIYEGTDTRAFAILCGALLACWQRAEDGGTPLLGGKVRAAMRVAGPVAVVGLAIAWATLEGRSNLVYEGGLPACSVLAALAIGATLLPHGIPLVDPALRSWPARKLGHISYGAYLWHWPVYLVLNEVRVGFGGPALLGARLSVTLALAIASYLVIEMPIRRGAIPSAIARPAIPVCMSLLALLFVVVTVDGVTAGEVNAVDAKRAADEQVVGAPKVLFLGDSVASSLADFAVQDPKGFGINAYDGATIGCGITYEGRRVKGADGIVVRPAACTPGWKGRAAKQQPDAVVVAFGAIPQSSVEIDGTFRAPCEPEYQALLTSELIDQTKALAAPGRRILLANIVPSTNAFRSADADGNVACWNRAVEDAATASGAQLLDLERFVCPKGRCRDQIDGGEVRPDSLHFHGKGGEAVARWVYDQATQGGTGGG